MITGCIQTGSAQIIRRTKALYQAAQGQDEPTCRDARALLQEKCIQSIKVNKERWKATRRKEHFKFHTLPVR